MQTADGNVSTTVGQQQISEVPNPGNDLSAIAQLAPGSVMNTNAGGGLGNFASFGVSASSNLFTLDGMDDNDPFLNLNNSGATNLALGTNEIQEATIVATGYSAQYGGLAGANINYVTKSGGNQFHGNAVYYWNGRAMNAQDWFLAGQPKTFSNANQWAGSLGGPIKKDKAFFFFNTEGLRVILPTVFPTSLVPTQGFETATIANLTAKGLTASIPFYNQMFGLYNAAAAGKTPAGPAECMPGWHHHLDGFLHIWIQQRSKQLDARSAIHGPGGLQPGTKRSRLRPRGVRQGRAGQHNGSNQLALQRGEHAAPVERAV